MGNQPDPTANPKGPGLNEHLTGKLRLLCYMDGSEVLQQEWEDLLTHQKIWRDVPVPLAP
jgi:hypothetical protein